MDKKVTRDFIVRIDDEDPKCCDETCPEYHHTWPRDECKFYCKKLKKRADGKNIRVAQCQREAV
mgnify:CR=1 FL=1